MLREDHAVMEIVGRFGLDGCHSLTAAPGRQPGMRQAREVSYRLPFQSRRLELSRS